MEPPRPPHPVDGGLLSVQPGTLEKHCRLTKRGGKIDQGSLATHRARTVKRRGAQWDSEEYGERENKGIDGQRGGEARQLLVRACRCHLFCPTLDGRRNGN